MQLPINLHEDLVHVPAPIGLKASTFTTNFSCKLQTKPLYPKANCFMTDINCTFKQNIFAYINIGKGREQGAKLRLGESSVDNVRNTSPPTG